MNFRVHCTLRVALQEDIAQVDEVLICCCHTFRAEVTPLQAATRSETDVWCCPTPGHCLGYGILLRCQCYTHRCASKHKGPETVLDMVSDTDTRKYHVLLT